MYFAHAAEFVDQIRTPNTYNYKHPSGLWIICYNVKGKTLIVIIRIPNAVLIHCDKEFCNWKQYFFRKNFHLRLY